MTDDKIQCPVCKNNSAEKKYSFNEYSIYFCEECCLGFTYPMPTEEALSKYYNNSYFSCENFLSGTKLRIGYQNYLKDKDIHIANAKYLFKKLNRFWSKKPGLLLEIGCAHGFFLHYAQSQGWQIQGIDLSEDAVNFAKEKLKLDVKKGDLLSLNLKIADNSMDVCVSCGTFDHLRDPLAAFEEVNRILKPGGLFLITLGDISSLIPFRYRPPEHLFYFSRKSLRLALEKTGFKIKQISIFWTKYALGEFLSRLNYYLELPSLPKWIFNFNFSLRVPTNEIIVIAQKHRQ